MHEKRDQLYLMRRHGLTDYSPEVKNALTNIVHEEFDQMTAMEWQSKCSEQEMMVDSKFEESFDEDEFTEIQESEEGKLFFKKKKQNRFLFLTCCLKLYFILSEQWILEEYQRILWEQKQILSLINDDTMCPICLKGVLYEIPNFVVCQQCGLNLPVRFGLEGLKQNIQQQVDAHSNACLNVPKFSIFSEGDSISLCFSCSFCDIFEFV